MRSKPPSYKKRRALLQKTVNAFHLKIIIQYHYLDQLQKKTNCYQIKSKMVSLKMQSILCLSLNSESYEKSIPDCNVRFITKPGQWTAISITSSSPETNTKYRQGSGNPIAKSLPILLTVSVDHWSSGHCSGSKVEEVLLIYNHLPCYRRTQCSNYTAQWRITHPHTSWRVKSPSHFVLQRSPIFIWSSSSTWMYCYCLAHKS